MAVVYVLFSPTLNKFYDGSCLNLEQRLLDHKNKIYKNSYTTVTDDWQLYYSMNNLAGIVARKIEDHIKSTKSKRYIENLKKYPEITIKLITKFLEI